MYAAKENGKAKELAEGAHKTENKSHYKPAQLELHLRSGNSNKRGAGHGHIASEVSPKIKFLCSFGGKILARPSDGRLRYVGGETKIITLNKDISWQELKKKTLLIYKKDHTIKYQLPREDLDALVSVSCDNDLKNMMDEFSAVEWNEGSKKPRLFLFSAGESDDSQCHLGKIDGDAEAQYVVAVNGMDVAAGKSYGCSGLETMPAIDKDYLSALKLKDKGLFRVQKDSNAARVPSSTSPSLLKQARPWNDPGCSSKKFNRVQSDKLKKENRVYQANQPLPAKSEYMKGCTIENRLDRNMEAGNETILDSYMHNIDISNDIDVFNIRDSLQVQEQNVTTGQELKYPSPSSGDPMKVQGDVASRQPEHLTEIGKDMNYGIKYGHQFDKVDSSSQAVQEESSFCKPKKSGDILIDIDDRFHPDFLNDMSHSMRIYDGVTGTSSICKDGGGLSSKIPKHQPKYWSLFQNLMEDESALKDISRKEGYAAHTSPEARDEQTSDLGRNGFLQASNREGFTIAGVEFQTVGNEGNPHTVTATPPGNGDEVEHIKNRECKRIPDSEGQKLDFAHSIRPEHVVPSSSAFDITDLQIIRHGDLEELRELGSGSFGTVYYGKWRGTDVAIKRIKNSCFTGRSSEHEKLTLEFWKEAEILSRLHHPNVVAFYGVVQDGPGGTLATVTEFMVNGSLRHVLLQKDKFIDRRKRLILAMDAAFGMEYLHSKNIVHFDLKCDNLLVNMKDPTRPICKVGDFGLSKIKRNTLVTGGIRGTLPWMAPELLNGCSNKVSEKVDVFSFGIVMWEILTGEEPYTNMHYGAIIGGIVNNTLRPPIPGWCDPGWRKLMEQCWSANPVDRPSFTEIVGRLRQMFSATQYAY